MRPIPLHIHPATEPLPPSPRALVHQTAALLGLSDHDTDALIVLCGLAFRNAFFTPDDNWGFAHDHPGVRWLPQTLDFDSYGVIESLALHLDIECRTYSVRTLPELATLVDRELTHQRPMAYRRFPQPHHALIELPERYVAGAAPVEHGFIVGLRDQVIAQEPQPSWNPAVIVDVQHWLPLRDPSTSNTSNTSKEAADAPRTQVDVLTVHPSPSPRSRKAALVRDVMRYALRHATSTKELAYGPQLAFGSGLRAYKLASELLSAASADLSVLGDTARFARYIHAWLSEIAATRDAAARFFARWAEGGADEPPEARATWAGYWPPTPSAREALERAADAYAAVADAARAGTASVPDLRAATGTSCAVISDAVDRAHDAEAQGIEAIRLAIGADAAALFG